MNIDKDIERIKRKIKSLNLHINNYYKNDCETALCRELVNERDALENVLKELDIYKKIAEFLAKKLDKDGFCVGTKDECKNRCIAHIINWAKERVENDK